ncbi:MAG: ArsR family transcriptional regulator [Frankiales bacterium]|nr:ArsR family transcriptional regulator [Frankiales bacterium]
MIELRLGPKDALHLRFAVSPLWETLAAVRALTVGPMPQAMYPWRKLVTAPPTPFLTAVQTGGRYTPDFLTPPPQAGERSVDAEFALVEQTPLAVVRDELQRARDAGADVPRESAQRSRTRAVEEMRLAWEQLLAPHWPRLHRVLATDVDYRSRRQVGGGISALMHDLHLAVTFNGDALRVRGPVNERRDLQGEGIVLMPSLFGGVRPLVILDERYQPTLIYPARGIGEAWSRQVAPADALIRLLGESRAEVLACLDEPGSTSDIGYRVIRADSTVSEHLHVLQRAGLVDVTRRGKASRWERTDLGNALVAGRLSS